MNGEEYTMKHSARFNLQLPFGISSKTVKRLEPPKHEHYLHVGDQNLNENEAAECETEFSEKKKKTDLILERLHRGNLPHPRKLRKKKSNIQQKFEDKKYFSFQNHLQQLKTKQCKHTEDIHYIGERIEDKYSDLCDLKFIAEIALLRCPKARKHKEELNSLPVFSEVSAVLQSEVSDQTPKDNDNMQLISTFGNETKGLLHIPPSEEKSKRNGISIANSEYNTQDKDNENFAGFISNSKYTNSSEDDDWYSTRWKQRTVLKRYEE